MAAHMKNLQGIYVDVSVWLQLRECVYRQAIYGCQKLIYNQCLLIRTFLTHLSICHLIRQLIKTDQ